MNDLRWITGCARFLLVLVLTGCVVPTPPVEPREADRSVPPTWDGSEDAGNSADVSWEEFFDPQLSALIDVALLNNQELNILSLEIGIAENEILARRGEYLPRVGVGAGAGIEKVGEFTSQGAADEATDLPTNLPDFRAGFFASWEVDVWGRLRKATKAAAYRYMASVEGRRFAVTRLVAELASSWYELQALDAQLEVLEQNIQLQQDALEVVRLQKQAGRVTELAVRRFEAEVLKNQSRRYSIRQSILQTENRVNFLVGRFPQPIARDIGDFIELDPESVQDGVPSQLLENRPDVRRAELELSAAELDVDVARARFYPSLEIEAEVGYESYSLHHLLETPESLFYGVGAGLFAPLLNRNTIEAGYFTANAMQMQAVLEYERTILAAYNEVANQLAMIGNLEQSLDLRSQEVARLTQSIEISTGLFTSARADYMEVLLTRRDALNAEMELIETKLRRMSAMVNLYQALGGGWRTQAATETDPSAETG